ncbi:multiple PDZ domain protein-like [Stylophora pistillata]|uniref:Multiple PDZ domain protein n=1 Tax=Stylophora pistillata TaxID=50429 RepID=A0A2B4SDQ9_STYPI|nr:multiple PDZ domain protein-like [Stylophora pistillata]PFX26738.1 Multiple PDZ domain protein [Stylophora pistillata]
MPVRAITTSPNMRAPNSTSFLSKAYNFFRGKTSKNDENFYAKTKTPFPNEIYPSLCEPIDAKGMADSLWKDRRVLGEITNRTKSMFNDREPMKQKARIEPFSPRAVVKNYWSTKVEKKINNQTQGRPNNNAFPEESEEGEEEGVFSIQLIKPQNGFLGIVLVGGADTPMENHYVNDILPNSSASKSGRVRTGDELLEANGQALRGKTHAQALAIFRSLPAVVTMVVARSKDANRSIMEHLNQEKKDNKKVNNNIVSPKKRRSIIEEAANSSVIARPLSSVIDVTKRECPFTKPVKRVSRVSSFLGTAEGENYSGKDREKKNEKGNKKSREEPGAHPLSNDWKAGESVFDTPQVYENEKTLLFPIKTFRRSGAMHAGRRNVIERCDVRATWPAFTIKQRLPLPWDSYASPRPAAVGRSSLARGRRNTAPTLGSSWSLNQNSSSSARKFTGKHYIEKKTLVVEVKRESEVSEWGFSVGGGVCSPYGDLPISIAEVSSTGNAQGFLQSGDEIVDFSGESLEGATFLEAEKMLREYTRKNATITIKRKFLQRSQNLHTNPYAEVWSSVNTRKTTSGHRQARRPKSVHC